MKVSRRGFLALTGATTGMMCLGATGCRALGLAKGAEKKPNVIFILTDDLGYGDVGVLFQNHRDALAKLKTPTIDQFAAEGVTLTDHYTSAPVCAPARATLMTGRHQGHCTLRDNQFDRPYEKDMTLATVMRAGGYATYALGKWGLGGGGESRIPEITGSARQSGFDHAFTYHSHREGHTYYHNATYKPIREDDVVVPDAVQAYRYDTDLFTARAEKYIADHLAEKPEQPFFMYLAYTCIHGSYTEPGAKIFQRNFHVPGKPFTPHQGQWPIAAEDPKRSNTWIHPEHSEAQGFVNPPMRRYATSLRRLDDNIADLMAFLKAKGIDENTLVIFTSDNGPADEGNNPSTFQSWGIFRGYKRHVTEGGVREPTFARWPGTIPAGRVSREPSQFHCWMPTLAAVAGLPEPAHSDGCSILPSLTGIGEQRKAFVYGEYRSSGLGLGQEQFLRCGNYMALRKNIATAEDPVELYDVVKDPGQKQNLANTEPARAERMRHLMMTSRIPIAATEAACGQKGYADAPRPYDATPVPAATQPIERSKVFYGGIYPWAPNPESLTPTSKPPHAPCYCLTTDALTVASATGAEVQFTVTAPGPIHVWIHRAHYLSREASGTYRFTARLARGQHPVKLFCYLDTPTSPMPELKISQKPIA